MSPEKQRIAIAEACGWQYHSDNAGFFVTKPGQPDDGWSVELVLDYLNDRNDLNAMHAEQCLEGLRTIGKWEEDA